MATFAGAELIFESAKRSTARPPSPPAKHPFNRLGLRRISSKEDM
jgi:hypothetical protein